MAGRQSPSRSYSCHSSYSVNGGSLYPLGFSFSHPSFDLDRPSPIPTAVYPVGGNRASESNSDVQTFIQFAESMELSYLGSASNVEFDQARLAESVGSYHSRQQIEDSGDSHLQDLLQAESHYNAPRPALKPPEPMIPEDDDYDYEPLSCRYTLNYQGDEREERRQGLRFLKDYYPPAGCPDGIHCPECASHGGAVCDAGATFRLNDL